MSAACHLTAVHRFREQAELIDRVFAYRFEELDKKWRPRFATMERTSSTVQRDVSTLQKDMAVVREGISILLKRRPTKSRISVGSADYISGEICD